jgi:ElaB/YqjD/DUF883 family membrane-anchored ribosome-binding protein
MEGLMKAGSTITNYISSNAINYSKNIAREYMENAGVDDADIEEVLKGNLGNLMKNKVSQLINKAKEKAEDIKTQAQSKVQEAQDKFENLKTDTQKQFEETQNNIQEQVDKVQRDTTGEFEDSSDVLEAPKTLIRSVQQNQQETTQDTPIQEEGEELQDMSGRTVPEPEYGEEIPRLAEGEIPSQEQALAMAQQQPKSTPTQEDLPEGAGSVEQQPLTESLTPEATSATETTEAGADVGAEVGASTAEIGAEAGVEAGLDTAGAALEAEPGIGTVIGSILLIGGGLAGILSGIDKHEQTPAFLNPSTQFL